ncbi:YfcC family protein [Virgibacillus sp. W0181]|uniref:YfcC family protein n=1 Tax=Virgibacillus sp. W0181 TaxID=3391581 RepID=UPI003F45DC7F
MSQPSNNETETKKKRFTMPHTYVLLFGVIIFAGLLTYVLPTGEFDRYEDPNTGRELVDAESYGAVDANPQNLFDMLMAIPKGMENAAYIIFFVFIVGGAFGIIQSTGVIDKGINFTIKKLNGKEIWAIPLFIILFSFAGSVMGLAEELLPFYPIMVVLAIRMGLDSITGMSLVLLGAGAGFAGAFLNPFTVGIAQGIAELPLFSGLGFRLAMYATMVIVTIVYIVLYARKIKQDPTKSPMYELDKKRDLDIEGLENDAQFSIRHKIVLAVFFIGLIIVAFGVIQLGWYIHELSAAFLTIGIIAGVVGGLGLNKTAEEFIKGAAGITFGALVIGIASGIIVVLGDGKVLDTIVYYLAQSVAALPPFLSAIGMFFVQMIINFFIPSGSGQAAASMPVMVPVADLIGMTRQTAVVAFQFGDGITNVINPTSAYFMAGLALAGIPWEKWAKWAWPLILIWIGVACVFLVIASVIGFGPF